MAARLVRVRLASIGGPTAVPQARPVDGARRDPVRGASRSMTLNEAARLLGVTPDNLRRQIHLGKLRAAKHGRDWWVEDDEVERYRKENRRER